MVRNRNPIFAFSWQQRPGGGEFGEFWRILREKFQRPPGAPGGPRPNIHLWRFLPALIVLAAAIWLGTGIYVVNPGEVGIVRTFGRARVQVAEGLHYHWPKPIERVNIVSIAQVQSMEVGFRTVGGERQTQPIALESRMITGDENLVDVHLVVQYRVRDAAAFLFNVKDPEGGPDRRTLRDVTESALRQVVGQRPIDDVLTTGKSEVQAQTQQLLQRLLDEYGTGLLVLNVQLQDVQPPEQVQEAFKDVIGAREDRQRLINEADSYRQDIVPKARGQAEKIVLDADAYKQERVAKATGEANRFTSVLVEYRQAQEATRRRLYLETLEEVFPQLKIYVIEPGLGNNLLPFLPIQGQTDPAAAAAAGGAR